MSRKVSMHRLGQLIGYVFLVYFIVSIYWYQGSEIAVSEETIGMYEYMGECIEENGEISLCFEPLNERKKSRENFYKFQIYVLGSLIIIFLGYKLILYLYPKEEDL